jgi:pimeloyl-ACP methyl ester carboxylesterase
MPMRDPQILLLPGLDGTGNLFADFAKALRENYEVEIVSYPVDRVLSNAELMAYVSVKISPGRQYIILGESFSGVLAIQLTTKYPRQIVGLVLCASFTVFPIGWLKRFDWALSLLPIQQLRRAIFLRLLLGRHYTERLGKEINHTLSLVVPKVLLSRLRLIMHADVTNILGEVKIPLLYLRGLDDWFVGVQVWQNILRDKPDAECVAFPTNHFILQTMPIGSARAVSAFATKVLA